MARSAKAYDLVEKAKRVVASRELDADGVAEMPGPYLDGFREGVAELLAVILDEPATDLLEEIG